MSRCKHKNGEYAEIISAYHTRDVIDGKMNDEGYKIPGMPQRYLYQCYDCGKTFEYKHGKAPKWLQRLHAQLIGD